MTAEEAEVLARLRDDHPFHARHAIRIVDRQRAVPLELRPAQQRFWEALKAQRDRGDPMRAIILKARKIGFSTQSQSLLFQRASQREHHTSLTVAHDSKTAQELFRMAELMHREIPEPYRPWLQPEITNRRKNREMHFGQLGSKMLVDTAREYQGGRGFTLHSVHLSEVALWPDIAQKMASILNAVPDDDPDTLVIIESTAKGPGYFRELWVAAEQGENEYIPFFVPWHEDTRYQRPFLGDEQRQEFQEDTLSTGPMGEDEPELLELGLTLEQLHWRRWKILTPAINGDLQKFREEFPSNWQEAFATTGRHVFAPMLLREARKRAEQTDPLAVPLVLEKTRTQLRRGRFVSIDVPTEFLIRARDERARTDLFWRVWEPPYRKGNPVEFVRNEPEVLEFFPSEVFDEEDGHRRAGQYVIVVDPSAGEERTEGQSDFTGVQVIDHIRRVQIAEMQTMSDPDLVAEQIYLVGLWFRVKPHWPLIVVEMTGGYGTAIADRLYKEYGYRNMYARKPIDPRRKERHSDLIGFSTDRHTKPRLVDGTKELLRERSHGIRSLKVISEAETYVRAKSGKTEAASGEFDDLLMPYMIGQYVCQERPPRADRSPGAVVNMATRKVLNPRTGY